MICPSCGAANDDAVDMCFTCGRGLSGLTQGSVIGSRYEILKPLGKGGMGMVYQAHDRHLDESVALKLLRSDLVNAPEMAKRFRSEIKLARKVRHPNVCAIHEYGEVGPLQFIVMEYIDGTNLRQELRNRGELPPDEAYDLAIQLAEGLQAVHDAGVIHRDLKTPNIMRDSRGALRLMDFGIAKPFGAGATTGATATGQIIGTPEYMSPEQCRGSKIDTRSDIYALGIVIYELFTGEVPFRGDTPLATMFKHLQEPPPLEGVSARRLPTDLLPILSKALAKTRDERFESARQVADALRAARSRLTSQQSVATTLLPVPLTATPKVAPTSQIETVPVPTPVPDRVPTDPQKAVSETERVPTPRSLPQPVRIESPRPPQAQAPAPGRVRPYARIVQRTTPLPRSYPDARPRSRGLSRWIWLSLAAGLVVVVPMLVQRLRSAASSSAEEPVAFAPTTPNAAPPSTTSPPTPIVPVESTEARNSQATPLPSPGQARRAESSTPRSPALGAPTIPPSGPEPKKVPLPESKARIAESPALKTPSPNPEPTVPLAQASLPAASVREVLPAATATPAPTTVVANGMLRIVVVPWANVEIDGALMGVSPPLKPVSLSPGEHSVRLLHPDYAPYRRKVAIRSSETSTLDVNLPKDAFPK